MLSPKTTSHFLIRDLLASQNNPPNGSVEPTRGPDLGRCQLLLGDYLGSHFLQRPQPAAGIVHSNEAHQATRARPTSSRSPPEVIDLSLSKRCCNNSKPQSHSSQSKATEPNPGNEAGGDIKAIARKSATRGGVVWDRRKDDQHQRASSDRTRRRTRTMFSEWQLSELEWRFHRNKYLITSDRFRIAKLLGLDQLQVKTWFQVSAGHGVSDASAPSGDRLPQCLVTGWSHSSNESVGLVGAYRKTLSSLTCNLYLLSRNQPGRLTRFGFSGSRLRSSKQIRQVFAGVCLSVAERTTISLALV